MDQAEDGPEYLRRRQIALWPHAVEYGGRDEVTLVIAGDSGVTAIEEQPCARACAFGDQPINAPFTLPRDHRPHLHTLVKPAADAQRAGHVYDGVAEAVLRP